eukprot:CAMPEP_0205961122 /NCGR_PEP_ID=MMETSP1459-20131121/65204_1 /ASSEMBLY_ACC=CAM_ASM_001120 /TAXON_ID=41880 /ORGANISM="Pycnococcus provasolii, Strain RCC931" /LENGTH=84 /DNA_ID=CAMNT_0053333815 /DNA_START=44 /DNA_END=298 /DNA_ORIENTATION=+
MKVESAALSFAHAVANSEPMWTSRARRKLTVREHASASRTQAASMRAKDVRDVRIGHQSFERDDNEGQRPWNAVKQSVSHEGTP